MTKDKVLSVRFSPSEYVILEKAAKDKKISPSTLVRSLLLTAIEQNFDIALSSSPSPNFDKLSFNARKFLLFPFELASLASFSQGLTVQETEKALIFSFALAKQDAIDKFALELGYEISQK